jgi:glutaredoxin 3
MAARMLFTRKGLEFQDIPVAADREKRAEMERLSGRRTVPQIFIDGEPVGGFDDVDALDKSGRLDEMLAAPVE